MDGHLTFPSIYLVISACVSEERKTVYSMAVNVVSISSTARMQKPQVV
jgi:hypothetical protein